MSLFSHFDELRYCILSETSLLWNFLILDILFCWFSYDWNSECRRTWWFWINAPKVVAPAYASSSQWWGLWFWSLRYICWLNTCNTKQKHLALDVVVSWCGSGFSDCILETLISRFVFRNPCLRSISVFCVCGMKLYLTAEQVSWNISIIDVDCFLNFAAYNSPTTNKNLDIKRLLFLV